MVTHLVKHITTSEGASSNRVLVSRVMGKIGGKVKPARAYAEMKYVYKIDPANGDSVIIETAIFPSGKYYALDFIPNWHGHRFIGWFKNATSPSAAVPSMDGELTNQSSVVYSIKTVYAHWQLPTSVTFDADTNGGAMPDGWKTPDYYAGQPFGSLPKPTHETLNFKGWYDSNGNKITTTSIVPEGGVTITARYVATSFTVDLNNQWRLSGMQNPDSSLYDGVYESFSNKGIKNSFAKMYIHLIGYTNFRVYIRSYAESSWDYTIAFNPDVDVTDTPSYEPSYSTAGVKTSTRGNQTSGKDLSSYTPVDYELDGGEHFIIIVYRKDGSVDSGLDQGFVLIPKEQ